MELPNRREYAVVVTAREQAELLPVERDPVPLGPREVFGRTLVTLVSPGTELSGAYQGDQFPRTVGYAAAFEIEAVGEEVTGFEVGGWAFCMGPHRSFQRTPQEGALPLPEFLQPEHAVFARLMGVTMSTLTTTTARPPEKVLVTGLGPVGHLGARIFALCGYDVLAVDPSAARRELAQEAGIRPVLAAVPLDDPAVRGQVGLALECSGHEQAVLDACAVVRKRGEVVLVGVPWRPRAERTAHELLHAVFHRYVVLRSGWEWELPRQPADFRANSLFGNLAAALRWLAEGRIAVHGLYDVAAPRNCQRVYQDLLHRHTRQLTAIFNWADCP